MRYSGSPSHRPLGSETVDDEGVDVPAFGIALDRFRVADQEFGRVGARERRHVDFPFFSRAAGRKIEVMRLVAARLLAIEIAVHTDIEDPVIPRVFRGGRLVCCGRPAGGYIQVSCNRRYGSIPDEADSQNTCEVLALLIFSGIP